MFFQNLLLPFPSFFGQDGMYQCMAPALVSLRSLRRSVHTLSIWDVVDEWYDSDCEGKLVASSDQHRWGKGKAIDENENHENHEMDINANI